MLRSDLPERLASGANPGSEPGHPDQPDYPTALDDRGMVETPGYERVGGELGAVTPPRTSGLRRSRPAGGEPGCRPRCPRSGSRPRLVSAKGHQTGWSEGREDVLGGIPSALLPSE